MFTLVGVFFAFCVFLLSVVLKLTTMIDNQINIPGPHYPINCTRTPEKDGTINVTFIPEEFGTHKIRVSIDGRPLDSGCFIRKLLHVSMFYF